MTTRRNFLKATAATAAVMAAAGAGWQLSLSDHVDAVTEDTFAYQFLTEDDRLLLFALVPVYVQESATKPLDVELNLAVQRRIDQACVRLPQGTRDELRELLDLLTNQLGRAVVAGVWQSWNQAGAKALDNFLRAWRDSFVDLLRSGYLGLHELIIASFYAGSENWAAIGYPGPPTLNVSGIAVREPLGGSESKV